MEFSAENVAVLKLATPVSLNATPRSAMLCIVPVGKVKDVHGSVDGLVSGYKKLRGGVWEVTSLPKNATGKFVRKELGRHKTGLSSLDDVDERARL